MTNADKIINPQHFGSDPADIRIQIRINPEIWMRIPDHFWLRLDALAEVCTLWAQSSLTLYPWCVRIKVSEKKRSLWRDCCVRWIVKPHASIANFFEPDETTTGFSSCRAGFRSNSNECGCLVLLVQCIARTIYQRYPPPASLILLKETNVIT